LSAASRDRLRQAEGLSTGLRDRRYVVLALCGDFAYHEAHGHIHFDDYALYTLQPVDALGGSTLYGEKVTFCVMDTTR
jgi:hypothetical protein